MDEERRGTPNLSVVLGIVGIVVALTGWSILGQKQADESSEQEATTQQYAKEAVQNLNSDCTSPPCWDLSDLMRASTVGTSKDLLDEKLPPATDVEYGQSIYEIDGCDVRVEYRDNGVSYISSALYKRESLASGKTKKVSCPFQIPRIMHFSSYSNNVDDSEYSPSEYPSFPEDNTSVTLRDILSLTGDETRLSVACIYCGVVYSPYIEAYAPGSRAGGSIDFYFEIGSRGHPDRDYAQKAWTQMQESFDLIGPDPDQYDNVATTDYCGMNVSPQMAFIAAFDVERVGIGRGTRVWSGPEVLFCP